MCDETDIGATATAHSDIADDLLAIHGISGADIVASLHGQGNCYQNCQEGNTLPL